MKRTVAIGVLLVIAGMVLWFATYPVNWENWLGFSKYDYFTAGTNYAFTSGPGPMILTALGLSTIIAGLWHHVNCHEDACWRIGKHKVNGTPWCNRHHENARLAVDPVVERLDRIIALLEDRQNAQTP